MLPSHQSPELAAAIIGMIASSNLKIIRDSLSQKISQIVLTEEAANRLGGFGIHYAHSSEAAKRSDEFGTHTYVTTPGALLAVAPDVAGDLDSAGEIHLKPRSSNIQLG